MVREYPRPRLVVSRCIEFDPCRYDGSKIPSPTVARLREYADCIPVCPEVEIGLGIPRATVRIVRIDGADHLMQPATGRDVTEEMSAFAAGYLDSLPQIDGFILKSFVGEAVTYARTEGTDEALREFNDRNGTFVRDSLYIYAFDYNGTTRALPHQPQLIGTDLSGLQDPFGVNYTRVEILLAQHGGGFVFYHYPNPAHNMALEPKMSYVEKVDDAWWLGAGVYLSEATGADAPVSNSSSG